MPLRMSGLISGMDTESIIKELMSAQSTKKTKVEQKKTKLEWKQEKWAELNTKIYKLYTDKLSKLRLESSYTTKKVTSSNEDMVTATATASAGSGSHTIEVSEMASAQYVTGKKMEGLKQDSKLTDVGVTAGTVVKITSGTGENATVKTLEVTDSTTIKDLVTTMTDAGLNASFDEKQGRFFINGKNSGKDNVFSIQTFGIGNSTTAKELLSAANDLKSTVGLTDSQISSYRTLLTDLEKKEAAYDSAAEKDKATAWAELQTAQKSVSDMEETFYKAEAQAKVVADRLAALKEAQAGTSSDTEAQEAYAKLELSIKKSYYKLDSSGALESPETFTQEVLDKEKESLKSQATANIEKQIEEGTLTFANDDEKKAAIEAEYQSIVLNYGATEEEALQKKATESYNATLAAAIQKSVVGYPATTEGAEKVTAKIEELKTAGIIDTALSSYKTALKNYNNEISDAVENETNMISGQLAGLGLTNIKEGAVVEQADAGMVTIIKASDSKITLDGAELTNTGNSFSVAGVTYNLKNLTAGAKVSITVTNDTQAVFDKVKDFVKSYNELLEEMNTLYSADSSRGYEPLSDEEKEAMSDEQIELWENKIKDSLLRRDDTLSSVLSTMRSSLQTSVTVNGNKYSLSSFGIATSSDYTEKGKLHIYGDSEDSEFAEKTDRLLEQFSNNPEEAGTALSKIFGNLYNSLQDKMKSSSVSSALTFYNDKQMKKQITTYAKDISNWETKLQDMENRYYKQFTAMETALSKLQSQSSYLTSLMGGTSS